MNTQEIQGHWNQIRGKVKEKWGQLTDDDLKLVGGNVDQLVGRIQQRTGEMRRDVETFLLELVDADAPLGRAKEMAEEFGHKADEAMRQGAEQVKQTYRQAEQMVQRHPAESLAVIFGCGVVTGIAVGMLLSSDRR